MCLVLVLVPIAVELKNVTGKSNCLGVKELCRLLDSGGKKLSNEVCAIKKCAKLM